MTYKRGEILLAYFPFSDFTTIKKRPVLVVQANDLGLNSSKFIVAQITSQLKRAGHPSRVLIKMTDKDAEKTGLKQDSVILTDHMVTIDLTLIDKKLGEMPDMLPVDKALRKTLAL